MKHAGIYPEAIPYRAMELVAFRTQGAVVFRTPEEYAATPRRGAPQWQGVIAVTYDGGTSYRPGLDERLGDGPGFSGVRQRILAEGEPHNGAQ